MRKYIAITIAAATMVEALLIHCSGPIAGIETTNGVTVLAGASSISITSPAFAQISLCNSAYIPFIDSGLALATSIGSSGKYTFKGLEPGNYSIGISDQNRTKATIFQELTVGPESRDSMHSGTLQSMGSLAGTVISIAQPGTEVLLYLIGTEYYVVLPGPGRFTFPALPDGVYELQASILATSDTLAVVVIISNSNRKTVKIAPDSMTIADTLRVP
jgi:hypothetical protein